MKSSLQRSVTAGSFAKLKMENREFIERNSSKLEKIQVYDYYTHREKKNLSSSCKSVGHRWETIKQRESTASDNFSSKISFCHSESIDPSDL